MDKIKKSVLDFDSFKDGYDVDTLISRINEKIDQQENAILQLSLETKYINQMQYAGSNKFIETFFDRTNFDIDSISVPVFPMTDSNWNNNWKKRDDATFKNGFIKPLQLPFMLQDIEKYNLQGVGLQYKCALCYDADNSCYWMMSNNGNNGIGEITKFSINMLDGRVEVIGRWYIPAGGADTYWSGITSDGDYLYIVLYGANTASKFGKLIINSDGTLGKLNKKNGQTLVNDNTCFEYTFISNSDTGYWNDVIDYSSTEIGIILCNTTTSVKISFYLKSNGAAGTTTAWTGFEKYVGGSTNSFRMIDYDGTNLWLRQNDVTDDIRFIYKFVVASDIVSSTALKLSGRFPTERNIDENSWGGVCVGHTGDILEITSTASYGKFITRRAITNALWSENQISGEFKCNATTNPSGPVACMVEANRYLWTADLNATANNIDIYRFDTQSIAYKHARLTGISWTYLRALTHNPTTDVLYLLGNDGTYYEIVMGDLSDFVGMMGNGYNIGNTIALTSGWGAYAGGLGSNATTDTLLDLCYDSDNDIIYIINDTDDKIDTLSINGTTWTQGVYDLPAAITNWHGIAYKNGNIFVVDWPNTTLPTRTYVLPLNKQSATKWYRLHIYQDPARTFVSAGNKCIDFFGNDLITIHSTTLLFSFMKTLEDPNVLQLHTFLDSNNILLSNNILANTSVATRYFEPEDFSDRRNCPDKNFACIGYGDEGFTVVHLDTYYSKRTSSGLHRYDVRDIWKWDCKAGGSSVSDMNVIGTSGIGTRALAIKDDIIYAGSYKGSGNYSPLVIIDLKSDKITLLVTSSYGGYYYNGTFSERNDGKGFTGSVNDELNLSSALVQKIHVHTFTKDDESNFNGQYPKTFVSLGTDKGNDVLVIDWDENNNRTPVKVWNNVWNSTTYGQHAQWIAPSGIHFFAANDSAGTVGYSIPYIWELSADAGYAGITKIVGSSIVGGYCFHIAENSRCWKTPSGSWRHQLIIGSSDGAGSYTSGVTIVDIENVTSEKVFNYTGASYYIAKDVAIFEDLIFFGWSNTSSSYYNGGLKIVKKIKFDDDSYLLKGANPVNYFYNNWSRHIDTSHIMQPYFSYAATWIDGSGYFVSVKYSPEFSMASSGSFLRGAQYYHFNYIDNCQYQSKMIECDNPEEYVYLHNQKTLPSYKISAISKIDSDVTYTNGATATWENIGSPESSLPAELDRDGTTEGYVEWENITGVVEAGIIFKKGLDCGIAHIIVTEDPSGTPVEILNKTVDLYDAENGDIYNLDFVYHITLVPEKDYTIKVAHNGTYNASASANYSIRIKGFNIKEYVGDSSIISTIEFLHDDFPGYTEEFTLSDSGDIFKIATFVANGSNTDFVLTGEQRGIEPIMIGKMATGGTYPNDVIWYDPSQVFDVTWGSNGTYNDETPDASYHFGVRFATAPSAGNAYIKYKIIANKFRIKSTLKVPQNGTYKDYTKKADLLDFAIELI